MPIDHLRSAPSLRPSGAVVFSDRALYQTYNFHDPDTLDQLANWLARDDKSDGSGVAIVGGRAGSGRDYFVRAAGWLAGERGARVRHARLSFDGFDPDHHAPLTVFADHQLAMHFAPAGGDLPPAAFDKRGALLGLAGNLPASFLSAAGLSFLAAVTLSVVDLQALLRSGVPVMAGPRGSAEEHLRAILDFATRTERLVLVLPADELPEPAVQWFVHEPRRNRRLSVVLSMARAPQAMDLYGELLAHVVELRQMTPDTLRDRVDSRFEPSDFPERFYSGLWKRTQGVPGQVALAMMDLERGELITRRDGPDRPWCLAVESDDEKLIEYFASHFYDQLNQLRNQQRPMDMHLLRFVELAALCGFIAPPRLIADYMGLTDAERDELLDRVDELEDAGRPVFVSFDYRHPTFRNGRSEPELVYRFADEGNRLIVIRRMVDKAIEARGFLAHLAGSIPIVTRSAAELFATLAAYLEDDSKEREEYARRLRWWSAAEEADVLANAIADQISTGQLEPVQVWEVASARQSWIPLRRLALLDAIGIAGKEIPVDLVPSFHALRARLLVHVGEYSQALADCSTVLALTVDPALVLDVHSMAQFCCGFHVGKNAEALWHAREAYRLTAHLYGLQSVRAGEAVSSLANALLVSGHSSEAEAHINQAIEIASALGEEEAIESVDFMNRLGLALEQVGRHEEAVPYYRKAVESLSYLNAIQGTSTTNYLMALYVLGTSLRTCGDLQECYGYFTTCLELVMSVSTQNHPAYGGSLVELLCIDLQLGNREAVLDWAERLEALAETGNEEAVYRVRTLAENILNLEQMEERYGVQPEAARRLAITLLQPTRSGQLLSAES